MIHVPKAIQKAVTSSFLNKKSTYHDGFFLVKHEKLINWLTENAEITQDSVVTDFGFFKAKFCWYRQSWIIGA